MQGTQRPLTSRQDPGNHQSSRMFRRHQSGKVTFSSLPTFILRDVPLKRKQGTDFFWNSVQEEHSYPDPHAHTLSYCFYFRDRVSPCNPAYFGTHCVDQLPSPEWNSSLTSLLVPFLLTYPMSAAKEPLEARGL